MIKIVVLGGLAESLINFRGPMLQEMVKKGNHVVACAPEASIKIQNALHAMGVDYQYIPIDRAGLKPLKDFQSAWRLFRLFRKIKPDIFLAYTVKPVIYGSLVAKLAGVSRIYSIITGLGYAFDGKGLKRAFVSAFVRMLYRLSLKTNYRVFFQNPDDRALSLEKDIVRPSQVVLVNGSGVDLDHFTSSALPAELIFLMIARLLVDKGIREYVNAAEIVKKRFPHARFLLVGDLDPNPNSVRESELRQWKEAGIIEYLGYLDDVRPAIQKCRCYVLPSYREGTPRTVLEAMSMGRPIITTDVPGCRETVMLTLEGQRQRERSDGVMRGENGFLVHVRDVEALIKAMMQFLEKPDLAECMAKRSREIAEEKFDVNKVNAVILNAMDLV